MKIYFCICANQQMVVPKQYILNRFIFPWSFVIHASKVFVINLVPTTVKTLKGNMPTMGMNFSAMKNVKFRFDLINEIEEGTELYNAVIKEMERLEAKNN